MYSKTKLNNITNTPLPIDLLKNKELLDVAKDFKETDFFKKYVDKVYLSVDDDLGGFIYFLPKTGYAQVEYSDMQLYSLRPIAREYYSFSHIGFAPENTKLYEV